jgi:hypothetical protein
VNLQRLLRRFRRELAANPKKAAVLGIVTLVAIYFWAPLIWKWLPGQSKPPAVAADGIAPQPSATLAVQTVGKPQSAAGTPQVRIDWQQLVQWRSKDPNTVPVVPSDGQRDPFGQHKPQQQPAAEAEQLKAAPQVTPQELGLTLTGTLIGPGCKVARINGRNFQEGQTIRAVKGAQTFDFTLVEVHARRVVLQRDSERFELAIKDPRQSHSIELSLQQ